MADNTILIVGGLAIVGLYLWQSGMIPGLGAVPVTQQSGNFPEQQAVSQTPGIGSIVITPDILIAVRSDIDEPIPFCDFDRRRDNDDDDGHNCFAAIKCWEQEHNHLFHTIRERNAHSRMRCRIIQFFFDIDFRRDFDDPIREHICLNKRVIIDECRKGRKDSPRCNSAALDVAQVTAPIIKNCNKCTVNITNVSAPPVSQLTGPINITNTNVNTNVNQIPKGPATSTVVNKGIPPGANTPTISPTPVPPPPPHAPSGVQTTPTTPQKCPSGQSWNPGSLRCVGAGSKTPIVAHTARVQKALVPHASAKSAYAWAFKGTWY